MNFLSLTMRRTGLPRDGARGDAYGGRPGGSVRRADAQADALAGAPMEGSADLSGINRAG